MLALHDSLSCFPSAYKVLTLISLWTYFLIILCFLLPGGLCSCTAVAGLKLPGPNYRFEERRRRRVNK